MPQRNLFKHTSFTSAMYCIPDQLVNKGFITNIVYNVLSLWIYYQSNMPFEVWKFSTLTIWYTVLVTDLQYYQGYYALTWLHDIITHAHIVNLNNKCTCCLSNMCARSLFYWEEKYVSHQYICLRKPMYTNFYTKFGLGQT